MRVILLFCCLGQLIATGQQLRVQSASARSVRLEWKGAPAGPVTVERTDGRDFQKIATASQASYEDATVEPFTTYRYRVSVAGKSSNEVIVGPPPPGVLNAALTPKGTEPAKFGSASAIALDENGDPAIAFEWVDPNGDGDNSDTDVRFVRWSRAGRRWLPAVAVQVVGDIQAQGLNPISVACDRKTGAFVLVTPVVDKGALVAISTDGGATWKPTPLPGIGSTVTSTTAAIAGGKAHVALTSPDSGAFYFTGPDTDVSSWSREVFPAAPGWKQALNSNAGLAIDSAGKPLVAWFEAQTEGDGRRFQVWRPGGAAHTAIETKINTDSPDLSLAAGGGKIGLLFETPLDQKDEDHGVWYIQSEDGSSWSKPSKLPVDGPRSTNPPLSLAINSDGGIVAVFGSNSGSDTTVCNFPALSRSDSGTAWKTCGPGKAEGGDFMPQPATLHVIDAGNGKAYVLWQETGDTKFHEGMLLWHER